MFYRYPYFIIILFITLLPQNLFANVSLPEFSLSNSQGELVVDDVEPSDYGQALSDIKNSLMKDVFILQNQINLLESMIIRQNEIKAIATNYERVGLPFKQPAPSENICKQIPANVLCFSFYPDLPINKKPMQQAELRLQIRQQELLQQLIADISASNSDQEARQKSIPVMIQKDPTYNWQDIRCVKDKCSALIISDDVNAETFRVRIGDSVNNNDIKIIDITKINVQAERNGELFDILPLPTTGIIAQEPISTAGEIAEILAENIGDLDDSAAIPPQTIEEVSDDVDPDFIPLGPTGLF